MKFCWKAGFSATGEQQLPAKDGQTDRLTGPTAKDIATAPATPTVLYEAKEGVDLHPSPLGKPANGRSR